MATNRSRGEHASSYYPGFGGTSGIKLYRSDLKAQQISGTLLSANAAYAVNHGLGVIPGTVIVTPNLTRAQANSATTLSVSLIEATSATTSAKFYIAGNKAGIKWRAYILY